MEYKNTESCKNFNLKIYYSILFFLGSHAASLKGL